MDVVHLNQKQLAACWSISEATLELLAQRRDRTKIPEALWAGGLPPRRHRSLRRIVLADMDVSRFRPLNPRSESAAFVFFCASITGCLLASDGTPLDCTGFGLVAIDHAAPAVIDTRR